MAKYGFIIDIDRCNGCYSCFLACKDEWIGNDHGSYGAATEEGMDLMRVTEIEYGTNDKVKVDYIAIPCQHCKNAPCVAARPDAFYSRPDGLVILDVAKSADKSLLEACPYGCISWNEKAGIAQKCNGCAHMLDAGEKQTRCSECCPNQALIFGDLEDPESEISKFAAEHAAELEELHPSANIKGTIKEVFPKSVPASEKTGAVCYMYVPKPFICGEVTADGEDVKRAKVTLSCEDGSCETFTDFLGDFEFQGLVRDKEYTIKIEADGYAPVECSVTASASVNLGEIKL